MLLRKWDKRLRMLDKQSKAKLKEKKVAGLDLTVNIKMEIIMWNMQV